MSETGPPGHGQLTWKQNSVRAEKHKVKAGAGLKFHFPTTQ